MARHYLVEPRMQAVRSTLIDLYLSTPSVNSLADELTEALDGAGKIYPARLHAVLGDDSTKSLNTGSLELLEKAVQAHDVREPDAELLQSIQAAAATQPTPLDDRGVRIVAERTGVPPAAVRRAVGDTSAHTPSSERPRSSHGPDWSWQNVAVERSLTLMSEGHKVGLFIPTGGGKTRVALSTALRFLEAHPGKKFVWVTHRAHLREASRRELQQLVEIDEKARIRFEKDILFEMVSRAPRVMDSLGDNLAGFIIDEAHHGAAPSYQAVLDRDAPGLLLTATPNRMDGQGIGVTAVGYVTTYRRLFDAGCVLEPIFEPALPVMRLSDPVEARRFARHLLEYTENDVNKMLVAVSRADHAEQLHDLLLDELADCSGHPLDLADVGFVHGQAWSSGNSPQDFLDELSARPRAIVIATQQLVGEGFSDRTIDGVAITYPSKSISNLMQVAGRALRYAPGKNTPRIIQVRQSSMEYHFDQRWLYQDISDRLRPELIDRTFATSDELVADLETILQGRNVPDDEIDRVLGWVREQKDVPGRVRILLSGHHYKGEKEDFASDAVWTASVVDEFLETDFIRTFNDVSERGEAIVDLHAYFRSKGISDPYEQKRYAQIIRSMDLARQEIKGARFEWKDRRQYDPGLSTSWLTYLTYERRQESRQELASFLRDCTNRDEVLTLISTKPDLVVSVAKLPLPSRGCVAYPLDQGATEELTGLLANLRAMLDKTPPHRQWTNLHNGIDRSRGTNLPLEIIQRIGELTSDAGGSLYFRISAPDRSRQP